MEMQTDFIFLHGGKQGGWVWDKTVAALKVQAPDIALRILALDVPGCGHKRKMDTSKLTASDVIAELSEDINRFDARNAVLVGHSQAGTLIPGLLTKTGARLGRVVHVSTSAPSPGQTLMEMLGTGLHGSNPDEVGWPLDLATTTPMQLFETMFCNDMTLAEKDVFLAGLGQDEWPEACSHFRDWAYDVCAATPATYVVCRRDRILTPPWQERFAQRFYAEKLVQLDAGHQAMNTQPQALAEILLREAQSARL